KIAGIVRLGGVLERTSEEFGLPESPNGPARRTSSQHSLKSRYEQSGETVGEAVFGSAESIHRKRPQALAAYVDDPDEAARESSPKTGHLRSRGPRGVEGTSGVQATARKETGGR